MRFVGLDCPKPRIPVWLYVTNSVVWCATTTLIWSQYFWNSPFEIMWIPHWWTFIWIWEAVLWDACCLMPIASSHSHQSVGAWYFTLLRSISYFSSEVVCPITFSFGSRIAVLTHSFCRFWHVLCSHSVVAVWWWSWIWWSFREKCARSRCYSWQCFLQAQLLFICFSPH